MIVGAGIVSGGALLSGAALTAGAFSGGLALSTFGVTNFTAQVFLNGVITGISSSLGAFNLLKFGAAVISAPLELIIPNLQSRKDDLKLDFDREPSFGNNPIGRGI